MNKRRTIVFKQVIRSFIVLQLEMQLKKKNIVFFFYIASLKNNTIKLRFFKNMFFFFNNCFLLTKCEFHSLFN